MQIFYTPEIAVNLELPEEEAGHCIRVLRLTEGDEILLTDGKGFFFKAAISRAHPKHCEVNILEQWEQPALWNFNLHIAVAPTKNMDRMEWFAEKATEIGINAITCLNCRFSERKEIKPARLEKILVSAMKQSQKATLPELNGMTDFRTFVSLPFAGRKFIAHCEEGVKRTCPDRSGRRFQSRRNSACLKMWIRTYFVRRKSFAYGNGGIGRLPYDTCVESVITNNDRKRKMPSRPVVRC